MKEIVIKPGSIIIWKETDWFTKLVKFFKKDKRNYTSANIYNKKSVFVSPYNNFIFRDTEFVVLEPKKQYSKLEQQMLEEMYTQPGLDESLRLGTVLNMIRPETVDQSTFTLDSLLDNKYYRIVYDSSKKN